MRRVHLLLAAALVFTLVSCSSLSQMMHSGAEAPMWYPDGRNISGTVCFVAYGSGGSPLVSRDAAYNDLLDRISEYLGYDVAGRYYRELSSNQSIAELSLEIDSTFTSTSMDGVHYHYIMAYAEQPVIDSMRSRQRVVQARMEDEVDRLVESSLQYYRDNNDVEAINELLKAVTISSTYGIGGEGRSPQDLLEKAMGYLENIEIRLSAEHPERAEVTVRVVRDRGLLSPSVVNAPVEATFTVHTHDDRFETFSVPFVTGQDGRFTFEEYYPLMTQSGTVYFSLDIEDGIDAVARVTGEGFVEEMRALASGVRASFDYSIDTPIAGMSVLLIMDEYGEDGQILDTTWARDAFADYFRDEGILVDVASSRDEGFSSAMDVMVSGDSGYDRVIWSSVGLSDVEVQPDGYTVYVAEGYTMMLDTRTSRIVDLDEITRSVAWGTDRQDCLKRLFSMYGSTTAANMSPYFE